MSDLIARVRAAKRAGAPGDDLRGGRRAAEPAPAPAGRIAVGGPLVVREVAGIAGLSLAGRTVTAEHGERILRNLREETWNRWRHWRPFSRQDFGHTYEIGARNVSAAPAIPDEIRALFPALREAGWEGRDPTQVIVTRYPSGGSLGAHIDAPVFGPEIGGISLGAEWPIEFSTGRRGRQVAIPLPVLSVYVMRGAARTAWFHRIPPTMGRERISLTFRTLAKEQE